MFHVSSPTNTIYSTDDTTLVVLKPKLVVPFGKIVKLEAQIYDGDSLHRKACMGEYLLKVNIINGNAIKDTLVLRFIDETKTLATDGFQLHKLINGSETNILTEAQERKIKKRI